VRAFCDCAKKNPPLGGRVIVAGRGGPPPGDIDLTRVARRDPRPDGALRLRPIVDAHGDRPRWGLVPRDGQKKAVTVREYDVEIARAVDGQRREDVYQQDPGCGSVDQFYKEGLAAGHHFGRSLPARSRGYRRVGAGCRETAHGSLYRARLVR